MNLRTSKVLLNLSGRGNDTGESFVFGGGEVPQYRALVERSHKGSAPVAGCDAVDWEDHTKGGND